MKRNKALFFVYGTLKKGYGNHCVIQSNKTKFLGEHETPAAYTLLDGGFPVVERGGNIAVKGELYEVEDPETIAGVFGLEGCSSQEQHDPRNWYDFDTIETPHGEAIIFVMDKGKSGRSSAIPSGVWEKSYRF